VRNTQNLSKTVTQDLLGSALDKLNKMSSYLSVDLK